MRSVVKLCGTVTLGYMCGRYSIAVEGEKLQKYSAARLTFPYVPRYNAAPSQELPVILNVSPNGILPVRWGIKRPWMRTLRRDGLINVRTETLKEKQTFRDDLENRRYLVLVDGFYEWKEVSRGRKVPFRFCRKDGALFAFAGLWEVNRDEKGRDFKTFSIVTTAAEPPVAAIHARMPVILSAGQESAWLSRDLALPALWDLMEHPDARALRAYEVSRAVNNARNDSPELILPVGERASEEVLV